MIEVEIKLPIADKTQLEQDLQALGFAKGKLVKESDTYFNSDVYDLRERDSALRIRSCENMITGDVVTTVTYKGPKLDQVSMTRKEIEKEVSDANAFMDIFRGMGFYPLSPVCKVRQYYHLDVMTACVDKVEDLGNFLELEIIVSREEERAFALQQMEQILKALGHNRTETTRTSYLSMLQKKI